MSDIGFDVKAARKEAQKEIREERIKKATKQLKAKLQELDTAKVVVANIERELEALEHELEAGI